MLKACHMWTKALRSYLYCPVLLLAASGLSSPFKSIFFSTFCLLFNVTLQSLVSVPSYHGFWECMNKARATDEKRCFCCFACVCGGVVRSFLMYDLIRRHNHSLLYQVLWNVSRKWNQTFESGTIQCWWFCSWRYKQISTYSVSEHLICI